MGCFARLVTKNLLFLVQEWIFDTVIIYSCFGVVMIGAFLRVGVGKYVEVSPASTKQRRAFTVIYRLRDRAIYTITPMILTSSPTVIRGSR